MFIAEQYDFDWSDAHTHAFLDYQAPAGIEGRRSECRFAHVWDNL